MCKFTLVHAIDCPLGLRKQVIHFIHSCPQLWAFVAFNVQSTSVYCCKFFPCVYIYRPVECTFVSYAFYLESYHSRGTDLYIASWQLAACKCYLEKFYTYTVKKHCMLCCCVSSSMWKKLFKTCGLRFGCTSMSLSVSPCCLWYFRMISWAWKLCKSTLTSTNWKACIFVQWAGLWGQYKEYDRRAVCQLECLMRTKDKKSNTIAQVAAYQAIINCGWQKFSRIHNKCRFGRQRLCQIILILSSVLIYSHCFIAFAIN